MSIAERPEEFVNAQRFHQQPVGLRWRTQRRTVTEYDLIAFVTHNGFNEALFLDAEAARELGFEGRLIPGAMSFALAEGLVISSGALSGAGLAFLGCTLEVWVEVTAARMTSRGDRGVVTTRNEVRNQRGERVLVYTPSRMVRA